MIKDVGHTAADQDAAEDVKRSGGNAAVQQKRKLGRAVFRQIADILEGRKADSERDGSMCHLLLLRSKDQEVKEQRGQHGSEQHIGGKVQSEVDKIAHERNGPENSPFV